MKRTFLLIAVLIIGAVSANAQKFISADALKANKKVVNKEVQVDQKIKKQATNLTKDAFVYGTPVMTVSFDDPSAYLMQNLAGHTAGDLQGTFRRLDTSAASTASLAANYNNQGYGVYYPYIRNGSYIYFTNRMGGTIGNGYAVVSPIDKWFADAQLNTKVYNTAIKCVNGFATTGFNTVDVVFKQICRIFNQDRYYIDYSTDPTFTTYDSIQINVKGIDLSVNEFASYEKRVTLPVASTVNKAALYIRLRYACAAQSSTDQPAGYFWMIDEINVYDGPAQRLDIIANNHYFAAYGVVPEGMPMDTITCYTVAENTGGNTLFGSKVEERFHTATDMTFPSVFNSFLNYTNVSTPEDITTATWVDTVRDDNEVITSLDIRRYVGLQASSNRMYNATPGFYGISDAVKYLPTATSTDYSIVPLADSIYYQVSAMPIASDTVGKARWASDVDVLIEDAAWNYGMEGNYYSENNALAFVAGYEVCNRFMTPKDLPLDTYYAKGIEVVPAADSCVAGTRISASLKYWNNAAASWDDVIKPVTVNTQEVSTNIVTTTAGNLNNGLFENPNATEYTTTYNSIYLPFNQANIKLDTNTTYYACYKMIDDGRFMVARDDKDYLPNFKGMDYYSKIVNSTQGHFNYIWGSFFGQNLSNYNQPMIRLMVSKNPTVHHDNSGLNDITTASFNLNAYPNPAQNEAIVEYSLTNNANVVITLTDIMGRNVLTMNKGNQAANTTYRVALNTNTLNNGTYFYTLNVNGVKETKKLVINK